MAEVVAVSRREGHSFSKTPCSEVMLLAGFGVEGDGHGGALVQHRSRVAQNPMQPNLRQVHLIHAELFAELAARGFTLKAGDLGENILTAGIDLLSLPTGSVLAIGDNALVEVTGLRNPCSQIEAFRPGLLAHVLHHNESGALVRKAGIMGVVLRGGPVRPRDAIRVQLPALPHQALERV